MKEVGKCIVRIRRSIVIHRWPKSHISQKTG